MVLEYSEENKRRRRRISTRWNNEEDAVPISSLIKKGIKKSRRKRPTSRKSRSKTRKPKYLSLRLQFSGENSHDSSEIPGGSTVTTTTNATSTSTAASHLNKAPKQQLNLFPLHPDDKEPHDENMPYLFSIADGGATTLTGLLGSSSATKPSPDRPARFDKNNDNSGATTLSPSGSLTYAYCGGPEEGNRDRQEEVALVRTALRNKEREPSEERWVRYSEVVERRDDQEVSSCAAAELRRKRNGGGLSLKLDYQEILSAWSDKGPLFIPNRYGEAAPPQSPPQTVPDIIQDDFLLPQQLIPATGMMSDGWGNYGGGYLWRVPEFNSAVSDGISNIARPGHSLVKVKAEEPQDLGGEDQWKVGHREDSVRRYKEKRLNRLFSKRIRYQVRKLNAEKRPRLKGRFVKRS